MIISYSPSLYLDPGSGSYLIQLICAGSLMTLPMIAAAVYAAIKKRLDIITLLLGIINLITWLLPICGGPSSLVGIGLGVFCISRTEHRTLAIVGITLSALGLLLTIANAVLGIFLFTDAMNSF